jgi:hypothetical protein
MNITLSADKDIVEKARELAHKRGQSLNGLIRDYMESITRQEDREEAANAFSNNALSGSGQSDEGFSFSREDAHQRDT